MTHQERFVRRNEHRIYLREYPGAEPAIILMHGFPDNFHLYDRLLPHLSPPRRVVTFDFLGWGNSDKPPGYPYTAANQVGDLDAVITQLGLGQVTLVVHDASGPPGIDWALAHPERVAGLVLLNTYYCEMPTLRRPEAIWLFSTPVIRSVARPVSRMFGNWLFRRMVAAGWSESPGGPCTHWKAPPCHGARGNRTFAPNLRAGLGDCSTNAGPRCEDFEFGNAAVIRALWPAYR